MTCDSIFPAFTGLVAAEANTLVSAECREAFAEGLQGLVVFGILFVTLAAGIWVGFSLFIGLSSAGPF